VPVLVHAYPDDLSKFAIGQRRDSFCGKFSVCSNLSQYRIPFSLTSEHTMSPRSGDFKRDLQSFAATCRVVRGLRNSRFGAVGMRPASFNSVRFSEKLLEAGSISVDVIDLADVLGRIAHVADSDPKVEARVKAIRGYVDVSSVPAESLLKMGKFATVLDSWIEENGLVGTAIQCWTALEAFFGIVPCTVMSMMSNGLLPAACEVDIAGAVAMYALQLASGTPSALVDWNNNYADSPDKCVVFHCSNLPKSFFPEVKVDTHAILAGFVPIENTWGTLQGKIRSGPATFLRMSTDDTSGSLTAYVAEGNVTDDPAYTWGGVGVVEIPKLQKLLRYVCENNFEHHVSMNLSHVGPSVAEGLQKYLGWNVHAHNAVPSGE
jgi:L-fucose isomerase-like protein